MTMSLDFVSVVVEFLIREPPMNLIAIAFFALDPVSDVQ